MKTHGLVVLGWGSLIPKPSHHPDGPLASFGVTPGLAENGGSWLADGPALPLELARLVTAPDEYPSWVITPGSTTSTVLYAPLSIRRDQSFDLDRALHSAVHGLAVREGVSDTSIGRWPSTNAYECVDVIAAWAQSRAIAGVVWTALPPKWSGVERAPSEAEILGLLRGLVKRDAADYAEHYIRTTPAQTTSPFRTAIERELGWTSVDQ
ncbi:MAG TPA: hypothetical protein VGM39_15770 [Kofleriaceae bacterium]|jgi:hypothetical protein